MVTEANSKTDKHNYQFISCSVEVGVARLELNRPEVNNAFNDKMIEEMRQALDVLRQDADCQILVVSARGKHFSAGADLNWMLEQSLMDYKDNLKDAHQLASLMEQLDRFPKPTLAQIQGAAYGGALGLICCCDIAIASPESIFCLSEVKLGLIPAVISPYVTRAMGQRASRRYMISGEKFDAIKALELQIIHEVSEQTDKVANQIIRQLQQNSPQAMCWIKNLLSRLESGTIDQQTINDTSENIAQIRCSAQGQEGLNAFLNKRPPNWQQDKQQGEK